MRAELTYKVYGKKKQAYFDILDGQESSESKCGLFRIRQKNKKTKSREEFQCYLDWIGNQRPSTGFELLSLKLRLRSVQLPNAKLYQHGYQSWSLTAAYPLKEKDEHPLLPVLQYTQENVYSNEKAYKKGWISEGLCLLYSQETETGILAGTDSIGNQGVKFFIPRVESEEIEIFAIFDFYRFEEFKGDVITLSPIQLQTFDGEPETQLRLYFQRLGKKEGVKISGKVPTGWCSWYYYYTNISERIILDNLEALKKRKVDVQLFQIDDGYQKAIGDWLTTNDKFPGGLEILSSAIQKEGFRPGIWLAPFLVRKESDFFQKYPEAVLKDEKGKFVPAMWNPLWGKGYAYTLDVTHPIAIEFLESTISSLVQNYGFTYLKLDFLYSASLKGLPYNRNISPQRRYREAMLRIRKTAGDSTFLLGCGAPLFPSIGIFDGMRIGCDVAPYYYREKKRIWLRDKHALSTERALINAITRSSMHKNLWFNDPDCIIVREKKNKMTLNQVILEASIMAVSGGMLLLSEDLGELSEDRLEIFRKALLLHSETSQKIPQPIGILNGRFPNAMYNPAGYLGIWNPSEKEISLELSVPFAWKEKQMVDFWTQDTPKNISFDAKTGKITARLSSFQSQILYNHKKSS